MTLNVSVTDDQLGQYTRKVVAIADRLDKSLPFSQVMVALQRIHDGQFADSQPTPVATPAPAPSILELVSTVRIAATTGKFVAKKKFVVNTKPSAQVKISGIGSNFKTMFLSGPSKVEDPITAQTLRYHKLRQASLDGPIITELGGEAKAETTLSEMFSLMEKQGQGEAGVLLTNGYANIFYIKDLTGVLRSVGLDWYGDGWDVHAREVTVPYGWRDGRRVFSRNSALEPSEPVSAASVN